MNARLPQGPVEVTRHILEIDNADKPFDGKILPVKKQQLKTTQVNI